MANVSRANRTTEKAVFGLGGTTSSSHTVNDGPNKSIIDYEQDTAGLAAAATRVQKTGGGLETVKAIGNLGATPTLTLVSGTDGNVQTAGVDQNTTVTMPSGLTTGVGISFTLIATNAGAFTATFTGVKWAAGTAPTLTSGAGKVDIFTFITVNGGTTWYGTVVQDVR
jgi:hypothetical protein